MLDLRLLHYFAAVVECGHFGRAAERLHMTQPPLSRAIRRLESDFGGPLLVRSAHGVSPTAMGNALYQEACDLLERAETAGHRVLAAAATGLGVGVVADGAAELWRLAPAFRALHPGVEVHVREGDLGDPTAGLHAGHVDVAITRAPFVTTGIEVRTLRSDPVGVVLRPGDELAGRSSIRLEELTDRVWCRFPDGTDPMWRAYWYPVRGPVPRQEGPVVRTVQECQHATLWTEAIGITPLGHTVPDGLVVIPVEDMPPSRLVVAWTAGSDSPLVASLVGLAIEAFRPVEHSVAGSLG
ncbi:LysR substrate-binding domain-containing protein [Pseudonocardia kongjuensis]|uniref:LysR substrate-binding domain-containing protein n=1 Tax=Pseudonocardia kongjuensis TaxID=102227 RepID=A0ABP4INS1_9PSEU